MKFDIFYEFEIFIFIINKIFFIRTKNTSLSLPQSGAARDLWLEAGQQCNLIRRLLCIQRPGRLRNLPKSSRAARQREWELLGFSIDPLRELNFFNVIVRCNKKSSNSVFAFWLIPGGKLFISMGAREKSPNPSSSMQVRIQLSEDRCIMMRRSSNFHQRTTNCEPYLLYINVLNFTQEFYF